MKHRILVINPGSTSTKIAVFEGKEKLFDTTLRYSTEELTSFGWVMEQVGRVPEAGDHFVADGLDVTVTKVDHRRVLEIKVVVLPGEGAFEQEKKRD